MIAILVVSNEERIGRHVRSVLGSQGWRVTTAVDREEALRASADQEPGLVVVDCEVEGAAELVRTFGAKNGGPGVLLLEPPGEPDSAFHAFEAGADQILSKPPRGRELLEAAERVMSLPHQSAGASVAVVGEKLSAADIFGEMLIEMEGTKPGPKPGTALGRTAQEAPESPSEPESLPEPEWPIEVESTKESRATSFGESRAEETASTTAADLEETDSALESLKKEEGTEDGKSSGQGLETGLEDLLEEPLFEEEVHGSEEVPEAMGEPPAPLDAVELLPAESSGSDGSESGDIDPGEGREDPSFTIDPGVSGDELDELDLEAPDLAPALAGQESPAELAELAAPAEVAAMPEPEDPTLEPPSPIVSHQPPVEGDNGRFGQYRLDERIAVGGMAEVWRASMLGLEGFRKTVAIKKILPHLAENSEFVAMFIEEAKLAAQLSHENLVEIYDLGKIGESFFIAMEFVDGKDLRGLLNRLRQVSEQMPIGLALLIGAEVARGLEYAHTREDSDGQALHLVHRDVSPRNLLIGHDGRVRLCDFGVAKAVSSVIQTQIGALKGKLQYMSPEQASGRSVDNRSDIYSLGSVMYEMISGRRLYEADNEISLLDAARAGNFDDPRKHCPGLPQEVRRILIKALAKKPSARYQRAGALEQDLRALLGTLEPTPAAQTLGTFVTQLFAERTVTVEGPAGAEVASASAGTATVEGSSAATRKWQIDRSSTGNKLARFWWGVAAGLLAAGLGAVLLELLLG